MASLCDFRNGRPFWDRETPTSLCPYLATHNNSSDKRINNKFIFQDIFLKSPLKLDIVSSLQSTAGAGLKVREVKTVQLDSVKTPCKIYPQNYSFLDCSQNYLRYILSTILEITSALGRYIKPPSKDTMVSPITLTNALF